MKKIIFTAAAFLLAASAHATVVPANGRVEQPDCAQLAEDVTLSVSDNVSLAYNCPNAGNNIRVAGCHTAGRQSSRTVEVDVPAGCGTPDANGAVVACTGTTRNTVTGSGVYVGGTGGGQLQPEFEGAVCDAAGATADAASAP